MGGEGRGDRRAGAAAAGRGGLPLSGVLPPAPAEGAGLTVSLSRGPCQPGGRCAAGWACPADIDGACVSRGGPRALAQAGRRAGQPVARAPRRICVRKTRRPMCTEPPLCSQRCSRGRVSAPRSPVRGSRAVPGHPAQGLLARAGLRTPETGRARLWGGSADCGATRPPDPAVPGSARCPSRLRPVLGEARPAPHHGDQGRWHLWPAPAPWTVSLRHKRIASLVAPHCCRSRSA